MYVHNAEELEMNKTLYTWIIIAVLIALVFMIGYAYYLILFVPCECITYYPVNATGVVKLGY